MKSKYNYLTEVSSDIELADGKYRKEVLKVGKWMHPKAPNGELKITRKNLRNVFNSYKEGVLDNVYIPLGHRSRNEIENDPTKQKGNVVDLELQGDSLYAVMDVDEDAKKLIDSKKIKGVSASYNPGYLDKATGKVREVINHVALVVEPYIKGMDDFVTLGEDELPSIQLETFNLSEDDMKEVKEDAVELEEESKEESVETTEETKTEAPKEEKEKVEAETEEKSEEKEDEETKLSETEALRSRVVELEEALSAECKEKSLANAEAQYKDLLHAGKVVPAQKESFIALAAMQDTSIELSDGEMSLNEVLKSFMDNMPTVVDLSEKGVEAKEDGPAIKTELRKANPDMPEKEFEALYERNEKALKEEFKK